MSNLILVRHGQSVWNLENRFTGWVDIDLSKNGIQEARKSGELISSLNLNIDFYFTSCLKRSINTLSIIIKILKKDETNIVKAWELNERHYGALTGLNKDEVKKKLGESEIKKFRRSWDISPPPIKRDDINNDLIFSVNNKIPLEKIPLSESLKDTYNRVVPYFEKEIQKHLQKKKNILVIAHGNSLRALSKKIFNISDEKITQLEIPTGNPLLIKFDDNLEVVNYKYLDKKREKAVFFTH